MIDNEIGFSPEMDREAAELQLRYDYLLWIFGGPKVDEVYALDPVKLADAGRLLAARYSQIDQPGKSPDVLEANTFIIESVMSGTAVEQVSEDLGVLPRAVKDRLDATSKILRDELEDDEKEDLLALIIKGDADLIDELTGDDEEVSELEVESELPASLTPAATPGRRKQHERTAPRRRRQEASDDEEYDDIIKTYLKDIGRYPLLTAAEERELARTIGAGTVALEELESLGQTLSPSRRQELEAIVEAGEVARVKFINANLRLVVSIAKKYSHKLPLMDSIQEGNFGLMHAITKFDPERGFKFSTYATWWIRQAITRGIANQSRIIRLPVHANDQVNMVQRARYFLEKQYGDAFTISDLAAEVGMTEERLKEVLAYGSRPLSLNEPLNAHDGSTATFEDTIADPVASGALAAALSGVASRGIWEGIWGVLTTREAEVLRLRFGIDTGDPRTLKEVGEWFGLTRERIRQIEARAMSKIRHPSVGVNPNDVF